MISTHYEKITTPDGDFDAFCALPDTSPAPTVLIFQEVFGINDNIRGLAGQLAEAGYLALAMPECSGRVGGVGFCLGGTLAYLLAATARVDGRGPDAAVSYYGSGVNAMLDLAPRVGCPVLFHYGARDPYIPAEQIDEVERALAGRPDVALHRYDAGHAFSNWDAPSMYDEPAARIAWERTLTFFDERL